MKLNNYSKLLQSNTGDHLLNIFMPSIGRDVLFKQMTVADVKTIARISLAGIFDINSQLVKLSLFDKLCTQDFQSCGLNSQNISQIDYFSFLIGIRQLLNNDVSFSFTCKKCKNEFQYVIHLQEQFYEIINSYQRKNAIFIKKDQNNNVWKFQLNSYSMKDYLIFKNFILKMHQVNQKFQEQPHLRSLLYITQVYKNNQKIQDWNQNTLLEKYNFLKQLPLNLLYNLNNSQSNQFLVSFIKNLFDEQKILKYVNDIKIQCNNCMQEYINVFNFDDLFFILGYQKDNQDVFSDILQAQTYLIYNHWFSLSQINQMGYFDFSIYSQKIFTLYEQEQKRKEQQYKQMESNMQNISIQI